MKILTQALVMIWIAYAPAISFAQKIPVNSSPVKNVYKLNSIMNDEYELPIEMGNISSKIFKEGATLEEGTEKIKYLSKKNDTPIVVQKSANKSLKITSKAIEKKKGNTKKQLAEVSIKSYPKGTIVLLDKTIIEPTQKRLKLTSNKKIKHKPAIKTKKKAVKITKVKINYIADETSIAFKTRKKLLQFVRSLRGKNKGSVKIVTYSTPVPFQKKQTLAENRIKYVKAFMREQGVNPSKYNFSSIHKKGNGDAQYLRMEFVI